MAVYTTIGKADVFDQSELSEKSKKWIVSDSSDQSDSSHIIKK